MTDHTHTLAEIITIWQKAQGNVRATALTLGMTEDAVREALITYMNNEEETERSMTAVDETALPELVSPGGVMTGTGRVANSPKVETPVDTPETPQPAASVPAQNKLSEPPARKTGAQGKPKQGRPAKGK